MRDKEERKKNICPPENLLSEAAGLKEQGAEFLLLEARRETEDKIVLDYTFDLNGIMIVLSSHTEQQGINSLYSMFPGADYPEREAAGLFKIKFLGNPNLTSGKIPESGEGEKKSR